MHREKANYYFEWNYDSSTKKLKTNQPFPNSHSQNYYTLRYFFNIHETFCHLFMDTKVDDKTTNENIEKHGILLRSWNPITKRGERYVFKKGDEGEGDLNLKRVYLPNTKTIFEFSFDENNYESSYRLAEEIIEQS